MGSARYDLAGAGTKTAALAFGGRPPGQGSNATEEFSGGGAATVTFSQS